MPNFGLVVTPTFNPMSYEQYVQPFKDYAEVYNKISDAYDALEMEAGKWEKLANSTTDAAQYQQYKKYADDLRLAASDLAENGLSHKTRSTLSNLRSRYTKEIQPISDAFDYRVKMMEEQRKLNPKGDLQWDIDFSKVSLGEIMSNPTLSYSPGRSLSEMEQAGFEVAKAASSRRTISEKAQDLGNQYYRIISGYSNEDINDFLIKNQNSDAFRELMGLYDQIKTSYNTTSNSKYTPEQNDIANERILTGMLKGLVKQEDYQTNHWGKPGASSNSGLGDEGTVGYDYIGYETTISENGKSKTYTVINDGGNKIYYDSQNNKITDTNLINKLNEETPTGRYYLKAHNNNADLVTIMDKKTGMPLVKDGKYIEFNRKTHYFDSIHKKVMKITDEESNSSKSTKYSTKKIFGYDNKGISSYYDNLADAKKGIKLLTTTPSETSEIVDLMNLANQYVISENPEMDTSKLIDTLLDKKELSNQEKEMLAELQSIERAYTIINEHKLSSEVLENPEAYTIQYVKTPTRKGRYSFIIIPKTGYSINQSENTSHENFNSNSLGG